MAKRGHKLMTQAISKMLPKLYATDGQRGAAIAQVRYFSIGSDWEWYATEFDGEDIFFGLVKGFETELGYFSLKEMESVLWMGIPAIERDLSWVPRPLSEVRERFAISA